MIKRVSANHSSFKTVEFGSGFNIVWADRTKEATKRDSRNGLGKSTLIEIIHFCLGARSAKGQGLLTEALRGWEFTLDFDVVGMPASVTRRVNEPSFLVVEGVTGDWPIQPKRKQNEWVYSVGDWNTLLGILLFGLPRDNERKYQPSFRSLISYVIRRGKDAYATPFEHYRKQMQWDKQVNNAFLLGLSWEDGAKLQELRDRKKGLEALQKAAKSGVVKGFDRSLGDLEARRVRLQQKADQDAASLASFRVHPQYSNIQAEANQLTEQIHDIANSNSRDHRVLTLYEKSLAGETVPVSNAVERMYEDAGIALPGVTLRRIEDVQDFHRNVVENRRDFLTGEVARLRRDIEAREQLITERTTQRAGLLAILKEHGALEEYTLLQRRYLDTVNELNSLSSSIENLKLCQSGISDVKIEQEVVHQKARRDYAERHEIWEKSIRLFNAYSEVLYSLPGKLVIDVGPTGFSFDVEIERSKSTGVINMKVFLYDLALATRWATKAPSPRFLIHDSIIFDGVDERQRALALELAARESAAHGFQYICTLNSDNIPWNEFSEGFNLRQYLRLHLTDDDITGCLLGIRF